METTASFNPLRLGAKRLAQGKPLFIKRLALSETRSVESKGLDFSLFARRYWGNIITILFMNSTIRIHE